MIPNLNDEEKQSWDRQMAKYIRRQNRRNRIDFAKGLAGPILIGIAVIAAVIFFLSCGRPAKPKTSPLKIDSAALRGHDEAENNTTPANFIWLYDNANGYCDSVRITGNVDDGYAGKTPVNQLTTQRAMDGFVFGVAYNAVIDSNQTYRMGEEHYFLHPCTRPLPHTTEIKGNYLDCDIPPGSLFNGQPMTSNYGIRIDDNNASITGNQLIDYTWGIMVRACDYANTAFSNYLVDGNYLQQAPSPASAPQQGIYIVGPITGLRITNNTIRGATVDPIQIYNASAVEFNNVKL